MRQILCYRRHWTKRLSPTQKPGLSRQGGARVLLTTMDGLRSTRTIRSPQDCTQGTGKPANPLTDRERLRQGGLMPEESKVGCTFAITAVGAVRVQQGNRFAHISPSSWATGCDRAGQAGA